MRATKTVNGEKYTYQYLNGKLIHETRGEKSFHYYYDANGYFTAIKYRLTPDGQDYAYYASHNWRGDVVGLYNGNGELVAKYDYDTWGKVKSVKDASGNGIIDQNHVGNLNPFRYRGYYYDKETQLYYLMSRYYDPVTHRFLNADGYFQAGNSILDVNMNSYCRNNPVNYSDSTGTSCHYSGDPKYHPGCHTSPYDGFCNSCGVKDCCYPEDRVVPEKPKPNSDYDDDAVVGNHSNNARPSTKYKHEQGMARNERDQLKKEKGDKKRKEDRSNKRHKPITPEELDDFMEKNEITSPWEQLQYLNPPMGDKPVWAKIWDDITRPFTGE